jgi:hypothetical protein
MWLLGAIAGLVTGGLINGWPGAMGGAILGAIAGVVARALWGDQHVRSAPATRPPDPRIDHIFRALRHIHLRLEEIEKRVGIAELPSVPGADAAPGAGTSVPEALAAGGPAAAPSMTELPHVPAASDSSEPAVPGKSPSAPSPGAGTREAGGPPPLPPAAVSPAALAWGAGRSAATRWCGSAS